MPGSEPYTKACNACNKQIIMGIDATTTPPQWRPWDDYNGKIKHNCKAKAAQISTVAGTTNGGNLTGIENQLITVQNQLRALQDEITKIEQNISMQTWMIEKIAKKIGVDDLIENQNG